MIHVHGDIKERKDNMSFKDYTLFSRKDNENNEVEEIKALSDCTVEELIEVAINENVVVGEGEITKEELIAAIEANRGEEYSEQHTGETEIDETINLDDIPEVASGVVKSNKLNVRKEPSKDAEILTTLVKDTPVGINLTKSTEDFYCIGLAIDDVLTQAYVMKDFIEVE